MPIRADFRWREAPALLFVSFQSNQGPTVETPAALFPVLAESRISSRLAQTLRDLGLGAITDGRFVGSFAVQGFERREFPFMVSRVLPVLPDERRQNVLLGLDFLAAFGRASLAFRGPGAHIEIWAEA